MMQVDFCVQILHKCRLLNDNLCVMSVSRSLHGSCCAGQSCDLLEQSPSCTSSTTACAQSQRKAHSCSATPGEHCSLLQQYCSLLQLSQSEGNVGNGGWQCMNSCLQLCVCYTGYTALLSACRPLTLWTANAHTTHQSAQKSSNSLQEQVAVTRLIIRHNDMYLYQYSTVWHGS